VDNPAGIITTVAGSQIYGFFGDGGPATDAALYYPTALALDDSGNLFISDQDGSCVRKVDTGGIITAVAGNGTSGLGDGGPATDAAFNNSFGIALDATGNLFIAESSEHRIRMVDAVTGIITTVTGNGSSGCNAEAGPATQVDLYLPYGVTVSPQGHLFIADSGNNRILHLIP